MNKIYSYDNYVVWRGFNIDTLKDEKYISESILGRMVWIDKCKENVNEVFAGRGSMDT